MDFFFRDKRLNIIFREPQYDSLHGIKSIFRLHLHTFIDNLSKCAVLICANIFSTSLERIRRNSARRSIVKYSTERIDVR